MKLNEFKLERLFNHLRPQAKYILSASACESCTMKEMLAMADDECLKLWENLDLGYTDYRGHVKLRESITQRFKTLSTQDMIVVTPEEGIFITMNAMLDQGDEVIAVQPTLPSMHEIPKALGCTVIPWHLEATEWGWKLDTDFLARTITPKTKMVIINTPNNPTGYVPSRAALERIAHIAERVGAWVFCEETFRSMEHDPVGELPSMADIYHRAIVLGGVNKLGLAGLRIGWLASQNRTAIANCLAYKDYTTLCPNAPSEILATIAMRNFSMLMERSHKIILENLGVAEGFFTSKPDWFKWIEPDGGTSAFPKLHDSYKVSELCDRAIQDAQILVVPDRVFGVNQNRFRLGFGKNNFCQALAKFEEFMETFTAEKTVKE